MKMVRTYVFDGPPEWLDTVLDRSLPNGLTLFGDGKRVTIGTIIVNEAGDASK